jgi:hypothetical protein
MEERIQTAYNNIRVLPAEENPVKKILLVVTGREAEVYLDEVGDPEIGPNLRAEERDQLLALHSQVSALQRSVEGLRASMEENRVEGRREFQMQSNIRRIAIQPVVRRAAAVANGPNGGAGSWSGSCAMCHYSNRQPTNTHLLWKYEHGIAGRKAARLYKRGEGESSTSIVEELVWNCIATLARWFHGPGCNRSHLPSLRRKRYRHNNH